MQNEFTIGTKSSVFSDVTPYSPFKVNRRLEETFQLILHDRRLRAAAHHLRQDKHQDMRQKTQSCFIRDGKHEADVSIITQTGVRPFS
jgi:hypothetical protein